MLTTSTPRTTPPVCANTRAPTIPNSSAPVIRIPVVESDDASAKASAATTPLPLSRAPGEVPRSRPRPASAPATTASDGAGGRQAKRQRRGQPRPGQPHAACQCREEDPHGDEASGHGLSLGLGVEVGHDPPARGRIAADRDEVRVLPCLAQRQPAGREPRAQAGGCGEDQAPDQERAPARDARQREEREREQRGRADAGAQHGEAKERGEMEAELLAGDAIAQRGETVRHEAAGRLGLGGARLAVAGQDLGGELVERGHRDAIRSPPPAWRLACSKAWAWRARGPPWRCRRRPCPPSTSSSRCWR